MFSDDYTLMDTSTRSLFVGLLLITLASASSKDLDKVKVKLGENVTLPCDGPKDAVITLLEWIRPDLHSDGYVFFYRDEHLYENYLHQSFVDRVKLKDPEMKDGDVSVILEKVTKTDAGTYQCFVSVSKKSHTKRATPDFSKSIELLVEDSGHTIGQIEAGGDTRTLVAVIVTFIGVVALGLGIIVKRKIQNYHPSSDEELNYEEF